MQVEWSREGFERLGFVGWKRFAEITKADLPPDPGVYVVTTTPGARPVFLAESVGGPHKRRPLTVPVVTLEAAWRDGAEVVYVGKAAGARGLQDRLWAYAKQGRGQSAGHQGGRYIWQLPDSGSLLVGWRATPGFNPEHVEEALLALHIEEFGRRPFANLRDNRTPPRVARALVAEAFAV